MTSKFVSKSRRLFGMRRQHWIKGFFGGNALVSFVVIFLISIFLIYEAVRFFPAHHTEVKLARKSGQEYVDFLIREAKWSQEVMGLTRQAFYRERDFRFSGEVGLVECFEVFEELIEEGAESEIEALGAARDSGVAADVVKAESIYREKVSKILDGAERNEVDSFGRLEGRDERWQGLVKAVKSYDVIAGKVPGIVERAEEELEKGMANFLEARRKVESSARRLVRLRDRLKPLAAKIREDFQKENELNFGERVEPIVAAQEEHVEAVKLLKVELARGVGMLPGDCGSPAARELVVRIGSKSESLFERLDESVLEAGHWSWDEEVSWVTSSTRFFFGTDWRAGSEWRQVFGLLPLLTGSIMISVIAMAVAVPFALGAAVYVNQLSTKREQALIKPSIEMIQAIPSVVLGFFGVMVLGDLLMELSSSPWFSWLPGFPIEERLNILNAGLLLALMAVPTIFTLCEDALNHVPRSLSEASLALGASKIWTVGRVVMPAAFSGIIAAMLLGFGRVIGETMVVLLVAGNRVAMPDWGLGLGVMTQPGHTMTGMIADEMGQVTMGTLHYRALFLLGLVLFVISLGVNLVAQRFAKRFVKYG